ncbi:hypothetical protein ACFE04_019058 [Oxalis oulophora]
MEPVCEFCGVVRAVVYCKSDLARLCLHCDGCVHSANSLSSRHQRSLLCDKCNSQPAIVRCMDEKVTLCHECDWKGNSCSTLGHKRQLLNCYTGCPSVAEFTRIWSSVLEIPSSNGGVTGSYDHSSFSTIDHGVGSRIDQTENEGSSSSGLMNTMLNKLDPCSKFDAWSIPSVVGSNLNYSSYSSDRTSDHLSDKSILSKESISTFVGDLGISEGLDVDNVSLGVGNVNQLFGGNQLLGHPSFKHKETGSENLLLLEKILPVRDESKAQSENSLETKSSGKHPRVGASSTNVSQAMCGNPNCGVTNPSCNININLGYPTGKMIHSSFSLPLMSHENGDFVLTPPFLMGDSPIWETNLEASSPQARDKAMMRYHEKKKTRTFSKQIRYASRKERADTRKRVRGRFVKAGEVFDYDPLMEGTSHDQDSSSTH